MNEVQGVIDRFFDLQSKSKMLFADFLESAKKAAARRRIGRGVLYNMRPYQAQRSGFKLGKEIRAFPKNTRDIHVYYLGRNDKAILVEVYGQSGDVVNREFYFYNKNSMESICFDSSERVRNITLSYLDGEKFTRDVNAGKYGASIRAYKYNGGLVSMISVCQKEYEQGEMSTFQELFYYSGEELDRIINSFPNGFQQQVFP